FPSGRLPACARYRATTGTPQGRVESPDPSDALACGPFPREGCGVSAAIVAPRMRWPLRAAAWLIAAALVVVAVRRIDFGALGSLIAAQLAEKGIQAISLGLVLGICALLPGAWAPPLALAGALALTAVALLAVLPRRAPGVAGRFLDALRTLHAERSWVWSLLWSMVSDAVDLLLVGLCLRALAIDVHPGVWAMVLLSITLALLLPSTPGHFGIFEAGAV